MSCACVCGIPGSVLNLAKLSDLALLHSVYCISVCCTHSTFAVLLHDILLSGVPLFRMVCAHFSVILYSNSLYTISFKFYARIEAEQTRNNA
jgi:hypothetical protein